MHPLRNHNFRLLLGSRIFASLSVSFFEIPIFWWLIKTTGSGTIVATVAFVSSVAYLLASPLGGVYADKGYKKRIIMIAYAIDASLTALAAYLLMTAKLNFYFLLVLLAITNLATAFRSPSLGSLMPLLIDKDKIQEGNAAMGLASTIAMLLSAAMAGIATSIVGPAGAIFVGAVLVLLALIIISFLREPKIELSGLQETAKKPGIMAGVQVLKDNPLLTAVIFMATLINFIVAPMAVLFAPYVLELGADATTYGILSAMVVLGSFIGMLLLNFIKIKRPLLVLGWGTFGIGGALFGLAVAPSQIIAAICIMSLGFISSILGIALSTIFQERVAPDVLGRTMGLMTALGQGAQPAGYILAGALLTITTARYSFAGMAVLMALASLLWLRPSIKRQFNAAEKD